MELEEKIELAKSYEATKKDWRKSSSDERFKFCNNLSQELFGEKLQTGKCDCVEIFFFKIKYQHKINTNNMERKFVVKKGTVINSMYFGKSTNWDDEKCIKYLAKTPSGIKNFEKYPSNWEEIVNGTTVEETETKQPEKEIELSDKEKTADLTKPLIEMSNAELKAFAKSIDCELLTNAKAKMIAEIEAFQNKEVEETENEVTE